MAKSLIVVESLQKLQTLKTLLPESAVLYNINGSSQDGGIEYVHHLIFSDPAELSFSTESKIQQLSSLIQESDSVYLATSPDLIGDALAQHILARLGSISIPVQRLFLPTLSKQIVRLDQHRKTNFNSSHASLFDQSVKMDAAIDYHVRRLLNKKRAKRPVFGLAAALALKKMCDQDSLVSAAIQQKSLGLNILLKKAGHSFAVRLVQVNSQPVTLVDKHTAKALILDLKNYKVKVGRVSDKSMSTAPPLPLTTAKLIGVAERYLGFSAKKTMAVARSLYNGCDIGLKNPTGLITHPVTDSLFCPDDDILAAREYIMMNYGKDYLPEKPRLYSTNSASPFSIIRPVQLSRTPKKVRKHLTDDQFKLYDLVWSRFIASQMTDTTYIRRKVTLHAGPKKRFVFQTEQNQTTHRGYLQVYPDAANKTSFLFAQEFQKESEFEILDFEIINEENFTDFTYNEGLLLEALGELDACLSEMLEFIPDILKEWKFIRYADNGVIHPTRLGKEANAILQRQYPDILSENFIRRQKRNIIAAFHSKKKQTDPVNELLKLLQNDTRPAPADPQTLTAQKCPVCGGAMTSHTNEAGEFFACEHFPETCHYSKVLHSHSHRYYGHCPECDAELTVKIGRFGRFLACSKFPKCKFTKPYVTGARCPNDGCSGEVIERTTKNGRLFYGCSLYPACSFSSWHMPVNMACPACGNLYMVAKTGESLDELQCPKCRTEFDHQLNVLKKA